MLVLTAPWWGVVVSRHGLAPFADAMAGSGRGTWASPWLPVKTFQFTDEPYLGLLGVLGLIGGFLALAEGRLFAPVWLAMIFIVNPRNPNTPASVPLAILVGVALDRLLAVVATPPRERGEVGRAAGAGVAPRPQSHSALPRLAGGLMLAYVTLYAVMNAIAATKYNVLMTELPRGQRAAMQWVADSTPAASGFIAMSFTAGGFGDDATSEWFPALARRADLVTVQGYEWLPGAQFAARMKRYDDARACAARGVGCLEQWAARGGRAFTHVFFPIEECCGPLLASLRASPAYAPRYERDGVVIFEPRR